MKKKDKPSFFNEYREFLLSYILNKNYYNQYTYKNRQSQELGFVFLQNF